MIPLSTNKISPSFDMKRLFVFYIISETLSFTEAAKILNIGQSTVSHHIAALEKELGTSLLHRSRRAVELTPEGKKISAYTKKIFSAFNELESYLKTKKKNNEERLCVYGEENSLLALVMDSIKFFTAQHPAINLDVVGIGNEPIFSPHNLYIGIFENITHQPNVNQDYLMTFHFGLYASKAYLKKFGEPQSLVELDQHRLIISGQQNSPLSGISDWVLSEGIQKGQSRTPYLIINSVPLTCGAVDKGLGIAIMARESCFLQEKEWVEILPKIPKPNLKAYFSYHKAHQDHPSVNAFKNHLKGVVQENGWT